MQVVKAKYAGTCENCGGGVGVGERVNWHGRGNGVTHLTDDLCREHLDDVGWAAEQAAELRMEQFAAAHMMGAGYTAMAEGWFD